MTPVLDLLRRNRNYRYTWMGQVVSEIGDYFNNIAVFSLVIQTTGSGLAVSGVMLARAIPAVMAGPVAGVVLDRFDRKRVMIASDLVRAAVALAFLLTLSGGRSWLLYVLSALLMFASPFFSSGRASILPSIAAPGEVHTANSLTQVTEWSTLTLGTLLAGFSAAKFGYHWAFIFNSFSFLFSALAISRLRGHFRASQAHATPALRPWRDYTEGLRYIRSVPLIFGVCLLTVGWATGGGAAQILFTLFGEVVFHRGARGIGSVWGFAGLGLLAGGALGHLLGKRLAFPGYRRTISAAYLAHGAAYVLFSQMTSYGLALLFIALSRVGQATCSVLNYSKLMKHTQDQYRGRVFATLETLRWSVMTISMAAAGVASQYWSPRAIGAVAGVLSSLTGIFWGWASWTGRLPEPDALATAGPSAGPSYA
jgi:MFS family permease